MMSNPDIPANVREVVDECAARFGENLSCALWHGSRARGEPTAASDDDLILVFDRIDDGVLRALREMFLRPDRDDWSAYVLSLDELREFPRDGRLQFHYGYHLLHGQLDPPPVRPDDLLAELRAVARDIRSYCRHPFVHHALAHPNPDTVRTARLDVLHGKERCDGVEDAPSLPHGRIPADAERASARGERRGRCGHHRHRGAVAGTQGRLRGRPTPAHPPPRRLRAAAGRIPGRGTGN